MPALGSLQFPGTKRVAGNQVKTHFPPRSCLQLSAGGSQGWAGRLQAPLTPMVCHLRAIQVCPTLKRGQGLLTEAATLPRAARLWPGVPLVPNQKPWQELLRGGSQVSSWAPRRPEVPSGQQWGPPASWSPSYHPEGKVAPLLPPFPKWPHPGASAGQGGGRGPWKSTRALGSLCVKKRRVLQKGQLLKQLTPPLICIPVPSGRFVSTSPGQGNLVSSTKPIIHIRPGINRKPQ